MLGMAWGIATVVLLLAYGAGFRARFDGGVSHLWRKHDRRLPRPYFSASGRHQGRNGSQTDAAGPGKPARRSSLPEAVVPGGKQRDAVAYGTRSSTYNIRGAYASYQYIRHVDVAQGSFFTEQEDVTPQPRRGDRRRCEEETVFRTERARRESIRIGGISYQVIGVLKRMIQDGDDNMNGMVYVPYSAMGDLTNTYYLNAIVLEYEGGTPKGD